MSENEQDVAVEDVPAQVLAALDVARELVPTGRPNYADPESVAAWWDEHAAHLEARREAFTRLRDWALRGAPEAVYDAVNAAAVGEGREAAACRREARDARRRIQRKEPAASAAG